MVSQILQEWVEDLERQMREINEAQDGTYKAEKKPPIGLRPRYIHDKERLEEIMDAVYRYMDARKAIPEEWTNELFDILYEYQEREE